MRALLASGLTWVAVAAGPTARADITRFERHTLTSVDFANGAFAGAIATYSNTISARAASPSDSLTERWSTLLGYDGFSVMADSNLVVNFPSPQFDPSTGLHVSNYTLTLPDPERPVGQFSIEYQTPAIAGEIGGLESYLAVSTMVDPVGIERWVLVFTGGGAGAIEFGGRFVSRVTFPGRWDRQTRGEGRADVAYSAAYQATEDLVYDPVSNLTALTIETRSYTGANPSIRVTLFGSAVPAPGVAGPAVLLGLWMARRRRRIG